MKMFLMLTIILGSLASHAGQYRADGACFNYRSEGERFTVEETRERSEASMIKCNEFAQNLSVISNTSVYFLGSCEKDAFQCGNREGKRGHHIQITVITNP